MGTNSDTEIGTNFAPKKDMFFLSVFNHIFFVQNIGWTEEALLGDKMDHGTCIDHVTLDKMKQNVCRMAEQQQR